EELFFRPVERARAVGHERHTGDWNLCRAGGTHPPLKGEGRTAEDSPGWGGGGATNITRPDLQHGRHPHPARCRGPTSPLQGEVIPRLPPTDPHHPMASFTNAASASAKSCSDASP